MMLNLLPSLRESDLPVLQLIAKFWGVDASRLDENTLPRALDSAMRDAENTARVWDKLSDEQRGALQTLIGAKNKMPAVMFGMMNGEVRKMGRGALERENPLERPQSIAEALFYRGLIYMGFEQAETGAKAMIYVPDDLVAALPTHKTAYHNLEALAEDVLGGAEDGVPFDSENPQVEPIDNDSIEKPTAAATTIVDDMATLLGYFQVFGGEIEDDQLSEHDVNGLQPHLIHKDVARLDFMFEVGISAGLIDVQDGLVRPRRAETKRWLEAKRSEQLKTLVDGWRSSTLYRELWHVEGLNPEPTGWPYDPVVARKAMSEFLKDFTPPGEWWSIDDFIMLVKEVEPDFQRPGGDYNSWYILNDAGEYLNGFESWDAIEGALLEFYLIGPMHWLGMVDLAEDAARLNAYGRSFAFGENWPTPPDPEEKITVQPDGVLLISRRTSRMDRFQAMRFTTWVSPATEASPYTYKLSMDGVRQAAEQGINTGHITAFLTRMMGVETLPPTLARHLETWSAGPQSTVTLEEMLVMRTTAPETLDFILEQPNLRRFCGARLGPMAVSVRKDQWEALREALQERSIQVEKI